MMRSVSSLVWRHAHSTYSKRLHRGAKPAPTLLEPLTYACVHVCSCRLPTGSSNGATISHWPGAYLGSSSAAWQAAQLCQRSCCALVRPWLAMVRGVRSCVACDERIRVLDRSGVRDWVILVHVVNWTF